MSVRDQIGAGVLLALVVASGAVGYRLGKGDAPKQENISAAAEVRLPSGNVIAARAPDAHPPAPPQKLPAGTKEVRRLSATVQPKRTDCPPVTVNASLVRDGDGLRAVIDSPDGRVTKALDTPIEPMLFPAEPHVWAAGPMYEPFQRRAGAWIDRDIGRVRVGAIVSQDSRSGIAVWAKVGFTF